MWGGFGGVTGLQSNDTWVLSNANGSGGAAAWTKLSPAAFPTIPRQDHSAVYDPSSNRMTIFGGVGDNGFLADLWVLSNANGTGGTPTWTQLSPVGPAPSNREGHSAVNDIGNNRMILFGGSGCPTVVPPGPSQCSPIVLNDVWVLSNANGLGGSPAWTLLSPAGGPPSARSGSSAVYNSATNTMTIFGGADSVGNFFSDVWRLSNANGLGGTPTWTQLTPTGGPGPRAAQSTTYHQATDRMTIFGGTHPPISPTTGPIGLNDTWVLTFTTATSTSVGSSANPSVLGQSVTFTATVSPAAATGTVTFLDGATTLGTATLVSGQAAFSTSSLSVGSHSITAQYSPNSSSFSGSTSPALTQNVKYGICVLYDQTKSVQSGAVFPIKVALCDVNGTDVSSSAVVLHATAVTMVSGFVGTPETVGNANPDNDFRFDITLGATGGYIFNLSTQGLASGTYNLKFTATGDPVTHSVNFGVK